MTRRVIEIIDEKVVLQHVYPDDGGLITRRLSETEARPYLRFATSVTDGIDPFNGADPSFT